MNMVFDQTQYKKKKQENTYKNSLGQFCCLFHSWSCCLGMGHTFYQRCDKVDIGQYHTVRTFVVLVSDHLQEVSFPVHKTLEEMAFNPCR